MKTVVFQVLTTLLICTVHGLCLHFNNAGCRTSGSSLMRSPSACGRDRQPRHTRAVTPGNCEYYRGADKSLARPGKKQANVSVRMAWILFSALPCKKKKRNLMTARISMLLKLRAFLICFRASFLPGRAKDLSASRYCFWCNLLWVRTAISQNTTIMIIMWNKSEMFPSESLPIYH